MRRNTSCARSSARDRSCHRARNQGEHQILVAIDQFLECMLIAGAAALDELALVDIFHPPSY